MGICITYKVSLSDPSSLDEAISEIRHFDAQAGWPCHDISEHYSGVTLMSQAEVDGDQGMDTWESEAVSQPQEGCFALRVTVSSHHPPRLIEETAIGVIVAPPDTESLRFVFDRSGRLIRYMDLPKEVIGNAIPNTVHYLAFPNFVKTSGAVASHVAICRLLRMLKKKFMPDLRVDDEAGFWKKGDVKVLRKKHAQMTALISAFSEAIEATPELRPASYKKGADKVTVN